MGDIADDMVYGLCCSLCGVYFEEDHGYPVVCLTCWKNLPTEDKEGFELAKYRELGE